MDEDLSMGTPGWGAQISVDPYFLTFESKML